MGEQRTDGSATSKWAPDKKQTAKNPGSSANCFSLSRFHALTTFRVFLPCWWDWDHQGCFHHLLNSFAPHLMRLLPLVSQRLGTPCRAQCRHCRKTEQTSSMVLFPDSLLFRHIESLQNCRAWKARFIKQGFFGCYVQRQPFRQAEDSERSNGKLNELVQASPRDDSSGPVWSKNFIFSWKQNCFFPP